MTLVNYASSTNFIIKIKEKKNQVALKNIKKNLFQFCIFWLAAHSLKLFTLAFQMRLAPQDMSSPTFSPSVAKCHGRCLLGNGITIKQVWARARVCIYIYANIAAIQVCGLSPPV